jgi:hypothetical protein
MQVVFKSGASILVPVSRFSTKTGPLGSELTSLEWTTPAGWASKLHYLNLEDVVAVVAHRDSQTEGEPTETRTPGPHA